MRQSSLWTCSASGLRCLCRQCGISVSQLLDKTVIMPCSEGKLIIVIVTKSIKNLDAGIHGTVKDDVNALISNGITLAKDGLS